MAIETPADYGGAESSFTSAIIAIEELAKIDPSVSVLCDVHNTLVNTIIRSRGTKEQKEKVWTEAAEAVKASYDLLLGRWKEEMDTLLVYVSCLCIVHNPLT